MMIKKILLLFCIWSSAAFAEARLYYIGTYDYSVDRLQCLASVYNDWESGENNFCYRTSEKKWACFQANSVQCKDNIVVCTLGTSTKPDDLVSEYDLITNSETNIHTISNTLIGYHTCAIARTSDNFEKNTWFGDKKPIIYTDCSGIKWQKNDTINKNNEIMVVNDVAQISNNYYPMQWWVSEDASGTYPDICLGYYCKDTNGKFSEPCDDGTCREICQQN